MRLIVAVVKTFKVPEIVDAVRNDVSFPGMTVCDVRGFGRGKAAVHEHTRMEDLRDFTDHCMLLAAVPSEDSDEIVERIRSVAHTGLAGDGKIFVLDLLDAVRIATGERGVEALR